MDETSLCIGTLSNHKQRLVGGLHGAPDLALNRRAWAPVDCVPQHVERVPFLCLQRRDRARCDATRLWSWRPCLWLPTLPPFPRRRFGLDETVPWSPNLRSLPCGRSFVDEVDFWP